MRVNRAGGGGGQGDGRCDAHETQLVVFHTSRFRVSLRVQPDSVLSGPCEVSWGCYVLRVDSRGSSPRVRLFAEAGALVPMLPSAASWEDTEQSALREPGKALPSQEVRF